SSTVKMLPFAIAALELATSRTPSMVTSKAGRPASGLKGPPSLQPEASATRSVRAKSRTVISEVGASMGRGDGHHHRVVHVARFQRPREGVDIRWRSELRVGSAAHRDMPLPERAHLLPVGEDVRVERAPVHVRARSLGGIAPGRTELPAALVTVEDLHPARREEQSGPGLLLERGLVSERG